MTVKDLIELLQREDPDAIVLKELSEKTDWLQEVSRVASANSQRRNRLWEPYFAEGTKTVWLE